MQPNCHLNQCNEKPQYNKCSGKLVAITQHQVIKAMVNQRR